MSSVQQRVSDLEAAERDYSSGLIHAYGEQRLSMAAKLSRIRRQIATLKEADWP